MTSNQAIPCEEVTGLIPSYTGECLLHASLENVWRGASDITVQNKPVTERGEAQVFSFSPFMDLTWICWDCRKKDVKKITHFTVLINLSRCPIPTKTFYQHMLDYQNGGILGPALNKSSYWWLGHHSETPLPSHMYSTYQAESNNVSEECCTKIWMRVTWQVLMTLVKVILLLKY